MLNVTVLTVFPELFPGFLGYSLTGKALEEQKWQLQAVNIRDYAFDRHKSVDDTPCGGGAGMIMRPDVLGRAIEANHTRGRIIYMSPKGRPLTQKLVHELSREEELTIVCGRFEGIDERVIEAYNVEEISIGDYILTGGELAAMVLIDSVSRFIPEVLGTKESATEESVYSGLLEYDQYTKPREYEGLAVPEVLLNGNHKLIHLWQYENSLRLTKERRPDLFAAYVEKAKDLTKDEKKILEEIVSKA